MDLAEWEYRKGIRAFGNCACVCSSCSPYPVKELQRNCCSRWGCKKNFEEVLKVLKKRAMVKAGIRITVGKKKTIRIIGRMK